MGETKEERDKRISQELLAMGPERFKELYPDEYEEYEEDEEGDEDVEHN
jgi:hypothetical protein